MGFGSLTTSLPYCPTTRIDRPSGVVTALIVSAVANAPGFLRVATCVGTPLSDTLTTATPAPGVGVRAFVEVERGVPEKCQAAVVALLCSPRVLVGLRHVALDRPFRKVVLPAEVVLARHRGGQRVGVPVGRRRVVGDDHDGQQRDESAEHRRLPIRRTHLTRLGLAPSHWPQDVRDISPDVWAGG